MSLHSVKGEIAHNDVRDQRIAAGTIGGDHAVPGSIGGRDLTNLISPFDFSRMVYSGNTAASIGQDGMDYLGEHVLLGFSPSFAATSFTGTSVSIIGRNYPAGGKADIYVDGQLQGGRLNTTTTVGAGNGFVVVQPADTTIQAQDPTKFTSTGQIQIDGEIITYTGTNFTSGLWYFTGCTRAANGTVAAAHNPGTTIYQYGSTIDTYSVSVQARATLWSCNNLPPGQHSVKVQVRSDKNSSSTGYNIYFNCFIVGSTVGASNIVTHVDYILYPSVSFTLGYSTGFHLVTNSSDQQIIGILGAMATTGGNSYCGVSVDPTTGMIGFYAPQVGSGGTGTSDVYVTVTMLDSRL